MFENPHFGGNDIYNKNVYITAVTRKKKWVTAVK